MPLIDSATLVRHAFEHKYAVAQVNTNGGTYDLTRAIVEVADELDAPIILGAYEKNLVYRGFDYAAMSMRWFGQRGEAAIAIHLDHGSSVAMCQRAIDAGFTSVMIDGSYLPVDENIAITKEVVAKAKGKGVSVEAEIGELEILSADGSITETKNLSSPQEVARVSTETGVDMLAVGIGNAHGFYKGQPNIRLDLLEKFSEVATVPLVLHGTTGLSDETVARCVAMGMAKVNLGTLIRTRYVEYTAEVIAKGAHQNHPWRVSEAVKEKIKEDVRYIIRVTGSAGKSKEVLACQSV